MYTRKTNIEMTLLHCLQTLHVASSQESCTSDSDCNKNTECCEFPNRPVGRRLLQSPTGTCQPLKAKGERKNTC